MKIIYFLIFCITSLTVFSQKEANIWYFGENAGVDFNSGAPIKLLDGALVTQEGCASIADKFGNILFYTDGIKVWNKLHVPMPTGTGLMGDPSSTQSAIIVPKPGSTTMFYIFTVPAVGAGAGLRYSEVDMTLDMGKGDVILGTKNTLLISPVDEKVTAVLHSNKKDIWVISQAASSNTYYSYLVTAAGIAPPITTVAGSSKGGVVIGYLKSSSDGKYLVDGRYSSGNVDVLKFNNTTGVPSTWFNFVSGNPYGVEFSPDNSKLYTGDNSGNIYQLDMTSGISASIIASKTLIGTITGSSTWAIQLGPDKKLYISKYLTTYLACIPFPDVLGVSCGLIDNAVDLSPKKARLGLPNFIQSFFSVSPFTYTNVCLGTPTSLLIQDSTVLSGVTWDFGDPASGAANTSPFYAPKHLFTSVGFYTVTAIVTSTCCPNDTLKGIITIIDKPTVVLGNDTSYCTTTTLTLTASSTYPNYLWSTAATTSVITVGTIGKYWVRSTNECGIGSDTIQITELNKPDFNLGNDTMICDGASFDLKVVSSYSVATYDWSNLSTSSSIIVSSSGKYWAKASNQCGSLSDTIIVDVHYKPVVALRNDTSLCFLQPLNLSTAGTYTNYLWNDGTTLPSLSTSGFGTYWLKVTNECGSVTDTFHLGALDIKPIFTLGNDTSFCFEESMTLSVKPFKSYLWNNGNTSHSILVTTPGQYWVKVWNECGNNSDTVNVIYNYCHLIIPNVITSNGDGVNDFFNIRGLQLGVADLKVVNRWGNPVYASTGYNNDWKPNDVNDGVYYYIMNYPPDNKTYTGFISIFNGK